MIVISPMRLCDGQVGVMCHVPSSSHSLTLSLSHSLALATILSCVIFFCLLSFMFGPWDILRFCWKKWQLLCHPFLMTIIDFVFSVPLEFLLSGPALLRGVFHFAVPLPERVVRVCFAFSRKISQKQMDSLEFDFTA